MNNNLSKSAKAIQDILINHGKEYKVLELPASTRTAVEAANAIGCNVAQILKSILFKTEDNQPILILASGINRINEKSIESTLGKKISKADAQFVREITGFAIGGIPPIGHIQSIETYIDEDLLQYDIIWAAAGTPNAVFSLKSKEILNICHGKLISIK